jgi:phenylalanyl-tRNA synthetase beta chain
MRSTQPVTKDPMLNLKQYLRYQLAAYGANEVLTYSFVHGNLLKAVGQDADLAYSLGNALSPDLEYYRVSLLPSLLEKVHQNIRSDMVRVDDDNHFAIFELGKAHVKGEPDPFDKTLPKEVNALAFVVVADDKTATRQHNGAAYYLAKKYLSLLLKDALLEQLQFEQLEEADLYKNPFIEQMAKPFEPKRSAVLRGQQGMVWGIVGEFRSSVKKALKLPDYAAGFEIDPLIFEHIKTSQSPYTNLPKFPKIRADITLKVSSDLPYSTLYDFVWQQIDSKKPEHTHAVLQPVAIYQADDTSIKNVTFRLWLSAHDRTLQVEVVNTLLDVVAEATAIKHKSQRV